jgi:hypothetical protein
MCAAIMTNMTEHDIVLEQTVLPCIEGGTQAEGFENKVLRRIFWPKSDKVTGEWRRLHNEKLYALYSSPYIIRVIKSRRLR